MADQVQRQSERVGALHKILQPGHVRVDAVLTRGAFGQVCGAAKAGQVGADDADVRNELQQVVRDDFEAVVVAAETVHEQHGVAPLGEASGAHTLAVLPVAGRDRLRICADARLVTGAGNERAGYALENRGVGGVRGNGGGHGYLSRGRVRGGQSPTPNFRGEA